MPGFSLLQGLGDGAVEKTRTSTAFRPQRPQRCASTNSATTACVAARTCFRRCAAGYQIRAAVTRWCQMPEIAKRVEWRISDAPVPYPEALAAMEARVEAIRAGDGAGAGLAARAPAALHGRHQRRPGRAARARALPGLPRPAAAAGTPITGRASAWPI